MNLFPELFIPDSFLTKSVGISLPFWPRKRLFGAVIGVPVLVIFRRDTSIVTTRLGRLQWTCFRNFSFQTVFWRNPWVAFRFGPENGSSGLFLGVPVLVIFQRDTSIVTTKLGRLQWTYFGNFSFQTVFWRNPWVLISLRFWPPKEIVLGWFWGPCARYFSPRCWYCHY